MFSAIKFGVFAIFCTILLALSVDGHKILVIVPMHGKSHWNYMKVFIDELLHRGHELTCITNMSMGKHQPANYTEILIDPPYEMQNLGEFNRIFMQTIQVNVVSEKLYLAPNSIVKAEDVYKMPSKSHILMLVFGLYFVTASTKHAIENPNVQKFIHSENQHFDLILIEDMLHDSFLLLGHKFKAPIVSICPFGIADHFDSEMGLLTPFSHVPSNMLEYTDQMTFPQRWYNSIVASFFLITQKIFHNPWQNDLANKHFGHLEQPLPSIEQLRKNVSITFVNAHRSIMYPRPHMPRMVYIGGAHVKPPKPLPSDLQKFMDESPHGVIYFSLGTVIRGSKMPTEKLNVFLDTFRQLKQRVIWKFEEESIPNLPENVLIRKWLPQTDILAHPNIVLFISLGGMFSNFEAINYGIQMIVIPLASDQFRNGFRAEQTGYAKVLNFIDITHESLQSTINEMLADKKYAMRAKEISNIFGDNIVHPMDEFIWWIEHVIKFRGAKYLKSHAADMSLFTYLLIDVMLANAIVAIAICFGIYVAIKKLCCKSKTIDKKKKTN